MDTRRAAAVLLLLAVAAAGLRAGGAFSAAGSGDVLGVGGHAMYWVLVVTVTVLAVAGLVLLVAGLIWKRGGEDELPQRKRRSIWWVLFLPLFAFGLAKLLAALRERGFAPHPGTHAGAGPIGGPAHHVPPGSPWPVWLLFAVVALVAGVLRVWRHRRSVAPVFAEPEPTAAEPLTDALAAGERALRAEPDPRTAIIGCYAAMERSLADAGSPAKAADTPAEVLARAITGGLVRSAWAATLTGLFRQARYSSHPMTEADRASALGALDQVRSDLGSVT